MDTGVYLGEDQLGLAHKVDAVIVDGPSLIIIIACKSLRRDTHHIYGTAYRCEEKEFLDTTGPLQHAIGLYVIIRLCRIVKSQVHGGINNSENEGNATNCDEVDLDIIQNFLVVELSPHLINVVYQISA